MTWEPEDRIIRAQRESARATAITVPCPYCYQPAGQPCVIPRTGTELVHQPAHFQRIRAVTAGG